MKILIIEDEELMLQALEFKMKKDGYEVATAVDGKEAIQKIFPDMPDLIIADIMIPFFTGLEIVNIVKNKPETKNIPIIMLSAADMESTVLEAFKLGADDYVTKPFSPTELSTRVKKLLNRK